MKHNHPKIEIMDTTLRDGEQTSGVSFVPHEKLMVARLLLEDLKVDRVEVASARVSDGEFDAVKMICDWAARHNLLPKVEVLGFVDGHTSVDWIRGAGCHVINLLCKGSLKHCTYQLKKTPEEHIENILAVVDYANEMGLEVNVYLEDWSNGMKDSPEYVFQMMDALVHSCIKRFMLPDTLGILNPLQVIEYMRKMLKRYPGTHFDFHAHNDYDLAVSNVLAAVLSGAKGLHTTINGLGERAGNAPLASVQAILKDHFSAITNIDESRLNEVSRVVESYSGIVIPANKPIVGENVFTQVAGVHADGDNKSNLYCNDLLPERFGRKREYALGKNSGKANIRKNLEDLGLELDEASMRKVTERIIELGDKKELVTQEDLPYIVSDVLKHSVMSEKVKLKSYILNLAHGLKPMATLKIEINGKEYEESSSGDGQYDAFVRALRKVYKVTLGRKFPMLTNYAVSIPPGGRTDAFVQTVITWSYDDKVFRTRGLDADQTEAAIKATVKMLNIIESSYENNRSALVNETNV
ncbi:MAG: 2-isopropylmalate synthase [Bacteroides sp.]|mgnify:CR=1 FL=1|jgi:D-citramalate synthase|nr:2-isopropylmalate synthase [Bacteroides sp.]